MAPEVRKLCNISTRCLRLTQLGGLSLSAYLDMLARAIAVSAPSWRSRALALRCFLVQAAAAGRGDP